MHSFCESQRCKAFLTHGRKSSKRKESCLLLPDEEQFERSLIGKLVKQTLCYRVIQRYSSKGRAFIDDLEGRQMLEAVSPPERIHILRETSHGLSLRKCLLSLPEIASRTQCPCKGKKGDGELP